MLRFNRTAMIPKVTDPLIIPTKENTHPADLKELRQKYSNEKLDEFEQHLRYKKKPEELPKNENTNYPIMYVFRHGETTDNRDMVFSGWRDVDLTDTGIKQAEVLAEKMKDKKIQMLIASDQIRAVKTMEIAMSKNEYAKDLEILKEPRIRERNYGDLMGQSKLLWKLEKPEETALYRRSWDTPPPNGESIKIVCDRVQDFLDEIIPLMKAENINVAISCHGNSIRGIRRYFEHLDEETTAKVETPLGQDYAAYSIK